MFSLVAFNLSATPTTLIDTHGRFRARPPETIPVRKSKLRSHGQPKRKKRLLPPSPMCVDPYPMGSQLTTDIDQGGYFRMSW